MPTGRSTAGCFRDHGIFSFSFIRSPQAVFLSTGLIFGLTFAILLPPLVAPDEWNHARRAYLMSEGNFQAQTFYIPGTRTKLVGGILPENYLLAEKLLRLGLPYTEANAHTSDRYSAYFTDEFLSRIKFSSSQILSFFDQPTVASGRDFNSFIFPTIAMYSPHLYLPQAAGIAVARLMGFPVIASLYAGRLFNLLVWLFLVYFAIRNTPVFKWLLLLLALTPTSLLQASSLSADAPTNGLTILLTALFLRYAYDDRTGKWTSAIILALSMLVAVSKLYFQFIFLYLLVPVERTGGRRRYWGFFAMLVAVTAASVLLWRSYASALYVTVMPGVSPYEQLSYIFQNPGNYLTSLCNTLSRDGWLIATTFVGKLGHYDYTLPGWLAGVHIFMLVLVAFLDGNREVVVSLRDRGILSVVFLMSCLWVLTSQYLVWTEVGASVIEGVQGRYFIPAAPLFFLLLYNRRFVPGRNEAKLRTAIVVYSVAMLAFSSRFILSGYYP